MLKVSLSRIVFVLFTTQESLTFLSLPSISSLAVGTKCGYKLFSLNSVEKLEEIYDYGTYVLFHCDTALGEIS